MSGACARSRRLAALPLVALLAIGCGSSGSTAEDASATDPANPTSPAATASATATESADAPDCATVWQEDATLPRGYRGCVDASGALVPRDALACSSGQRLMSHADRFWAVPGGTIHEASASLGDDPEYRSAVRSCRA